MSKNLLDLLLGDDNKGAIDQISQNYNLSEKETRTAVEELIPALSRGLNQNSKQTPGMDDLLEALRTGKHASYVDNPGQLGKPETVQQGNDILGHIFGSKEVSREVANRASRSSGLSSTVLKKLLPVLATVVMGTLGKKVLGGSSAPANRSSSGGLLNSLLDSDGDGSIWDDVLGMAARGLLR